ncbi:hypothetical protein OSO01_36370 [Oceanobacillus sojae]|uniref:Uncharacterized protein n=1 Tax=Oceanobacillus sojae TaxID=582851 RepID=A0A511ZN74_9BACI|nr:hypothetical protein OSO01_36370 [Oceanobacillus sojae]
MCVYFLYVNKEYKENEGCKGKGLLPEFPGLCVGTQVKGKRYLKFSKHNHEKENQ